MERPSLYSVEIFDNFFAVPLVAPYLTDLDNSYEVGDISYEVHTATTSKSLLSQVNSLIDEHVETQFSGEWMLVAEWKDVPEFGNPFIVSLSFFYTFMYNNYYGI